MTIHRGFRIATPSRSASGRWACTAVDPLRVWHASTLATTPQISRLAALAQVEANIADAIKAEVQEVCEAWSEMSSVND
jgi:hypothetical protein